MRRLFFLSFLLPVILTLFISIFIIPAVYSQSYAIKYNNNIVNLTQKQVYIWPVPGYNTITSNFGYRVSPTSGASIYHGGIDIGASQDAEIHAIADGTVKFIGWNGANGYTVMISHKGNVVSTYGHISDTFLVSTGDTVCQGDVIAKVGPKYIDGPANNPYKDSTGKTTNGATTGPHLHFAISINNKKVNPIDYLK